MSFFAYGHRKISPKVIGVTLFCVTILLLAEWTAFYRLKREHHEEMKSILIDFASKDAQLLSFKIERRIEFLDKISKIENISSNNFLNYYNESDALTSFYAKGWFSPNGKSTFVKAGNTFNPKLSEKTIQHFLDEDEAMAFVDIEGRSFLGLSKAVYNKQNQKEGVLAAFLADTMLHSIPFERQTAIVLLNGDGKIIKDMTLTNSTKAKTPSELMVEKALFEALEKDSPSFNKKEKGGILLTPAKTNSQYYAIYVPLGFHDWTVVSVFPAEVIEGSIHYLNYLFNGLFIFSGLLLFGLLLYSYLLRRYYHFDLEKMISYDRLTGALTKNKLFWILKTSLKPIPGYQEALVVTNIRNFGLFNTIFGREASDSILQRSKILFEQKLKKNEWLARAFADRFYLILYYKEETDLIGRLEAMSKDLQINNEDITGTYPMHYCFGVFKVPKPYKKEYPEMFDLADMALKRGLGNGSKNIFFYDQLIQKSIEKEMTIESRMEEALIKKEFLMYLQPKFDTITEQIVGAEALVRWQTPNEMLFPDSFIPIFERNGFISKLDMYMLEQVCLLQRRRLNENKTAVPISVNQSRLLLYNPSYVDTLIDLVDRYEIPHHLIELEITETVVFEDKLVAIKTFRQLLDRGFKILMDDFGSGYSSLNMLKEIDVSAIKIDRAFLENFMNSDRGRKVMFSVLVLIRELNLMSVAEGVETKEQLDFLKNAGCHWVQGFYFSKPVPVSEFLKKLDIDTLINVL
jgi:EAL domain-containing protein (putative c-di-GMP-specific phosphodiesterase class I)/GGDEF domain-containing protein